jgi:Fe2+ transport system protein FeoA
MSDSCPDLLSLRRGTAGRVRGLAEHLDGALQHRLRALGLRPGVEVTARGRAPLGSPWLFDVGSAQLCLRRREAAAVLIDPMPLAPSVEPTTSSVAG